MGRLCVRCLLWCEMTDFDIYEHRLDPEQAHWELPAWGHALGLFALPLFVTFEERYIPIGTAFRIGQGVGFVLTANHNVREALKRDGRFDRELTSTQLPPNLDLRNAGLCVLHQVVGSDGVLRLTFTPLENVHGAPPTDVVLGYPSFEPNRPSLSFPLSFKPPRIDDIVWSIGYTDFKPEEGFSFEFVRAGGLTLETYRHRFLVVEGRIKRIFAQGFASSIPTGPCFAFDSDIPHGLSGGPILSTDGCIVGLNSAGAALYFGSPMSLGSMLFPLINTVVRFQASIQFAPEFRMDLNGSRRVIDLIGQGLLATDGSEENLTFRHAEEGGIAIGFSAPLEDREFIHDDFAGFQAGATATAQTKQVFRVRRRQAGNEEP